MKLQVKLSISLTRKPKSSSTGDEDPPHVEDKSGSAIEKADPTPVGFVIPSSAPSFPFETEERR